MFKHVLSQSHPLKILFVSITIISDKEYVLLSSLLCHFLFHSITCYYVHIFSLQHPLYMNKHFYLNSHVCTTDIHLVFRTILSFLQMNILNRCLYKCSKNVVSLNSILCTKYYLHDISLLSFLPCIKPLPYPFMA
jgi:hypothetical protein